MVATLQQFVTTLSYRDLGEKLKPATRGGPVLLPVLQRSRFANIHQLGQTSFFPIQWVNLFWRYHRDGLGRLGVGLGKLHGLRVGRSPFGCV